MNHDTHVKAVRRALLPVWIRFFSWIFLIFALAPLLLVVGLVVPISANFSLFGVSYAGSPLAPQALLIIAILTFMSVAAYGLLWGRPWGVDAGLAAGIIGLAISVFNTVASGFTSIGLEPILQIPFIIVLVRIRPSWRAAGTTRGPLATLGELPTGPGEHGASPGAQETE